MTAAEWKEITDDHARKLFDAYQDAGRPDEYWGDCLDCHSCGCTTCHQVGYIPDDVWNELFMEVNRGSKL